jgi:hypothetical protein
VRKVKKPRFETTLINKYGYNMMTACEVPMNVLQSNILTLKKTAKRRQKDTRAKKFYMIDNQENNDTTGPTVLKEFSEPRIS